MGKIVQTTDFVGIYSITQNGHNTPRLQAFIDKYEILYLYDLLGITLGDLFYADIVTDFTAPVTTKYATLFNSLYDDNDNSTICQQIRSEGIKEMLLGFIFWEYVKTQKSFNTITGNVIQSNEVSREALPGETNIYDNYNKALVSYKSIQIYINKNLTDYPEYNGSLKQYANFVI